MVELPPFLDISLLMNRTYIKDKATGMNEQPLSL